MVDPRVGTEFRVATTTAGAQQASTAAALSAGGFVVGWVGDTTAGRNVFGQRYAADGSRISGEFAFAASTTDRQSEPAMVGTADGGFAVAWTSTGQDGSGKSIHARRFAPTGAALDVEFRLNTTVANDQARPSIVFRNATDFLATWTSTAQDGSMEGVYGQRFSLAP